MPFVTEEAAKEVEIVLEMLDSVSSTATALPSCGHHVK